MAYLAHDDRDFFAHLIILLPPGPVPMEQHTVDYFWNYGGSIILVQEPEPGAMRRAGNA